MRRLRVLLGALVVFLALAAPAAAHIVVVESSGTVQWVGGGPVPGQGEGLIASPVGMLPPAHGNGLVHACVMTMGNPSAAVFLAPPYFTGCHHGLP